jgi:molybdenum cofactor synthesis domain-containing protein
MQPLRADTAAALIIGNELLSGKVAESNLVELARTLRAIGVSLRRVVTLPDELEALAQEIRVLSAAHDVLFTSGGVGPTHDDVTVEAVARAFGVSVVLHPELAAVIRRAYGDACTDAHLRMALVPEGARLATAPEVDWPLPVMNNVFILPGVPEAFRAKLSAVRSWVRGPLPFVSRAAFTLLDEANLKTLLDAVVARHPSVEVGSYPRWFEPSYKTKVTFDGRESVAVDAALADFLAGLPEGSLVRSE